MSTGRAARAASGVPLAARLRPRTLDEVVGHEALLGDGKPLRRAIAS
ncbi:MAG: recombination factor protein RarA, partial [Gemmatimonadetes bacterium]|nr:recombination factor protein RarA [Gemmatimonadota bacterium]